MLIGKQRRYCSDIPRDLHHQDEKKREKLIELKAKEPRFCKYEFCKKQLPYENSRKAYCMNTDCYLQQTAIEAKRKREATPKKKHFKECKLDGCGEMFEKRPQFPRQEYCSTESRMSGKTKRQREIKQKEGAYVRLKSIGKEKPNIKIHDRFTQPRGSKQRKALGLEPIEFDMCRGYIVEAGA